MTLSNVDAFFNVYEKLKTIKMPIRIAYKFAKIASQYRDDYRFYQEQMTVILNEFVEKDENGQPVKSGEGFALKKDSMEQFSNRVQVLASQKIDDPISQLTLEDLDGWGEVTPSELESLIPFTTELNG